MLAGFRTRQQQSSDFATILVQLPSPVWHKRGKKQEFMIVLNANREAKPQGKQNFHLHSAILKLWVPAIHKEDVLHQGIFEITSMM